MTTSLLEAARDLYSTIDANAIAAGSDPVSPDTVNALIDAGLYGVLVPREVGGAGLSVADTVDVFAEVARADGSTGWCLMAGAGVVSFFGAYAGDDFVSEMFARGVPTMAFGAPTTGFGVGARERDGYRVSGRFGFGSGVNHARWVGVAFSPESTESDLSQVLFGAVPADQVKLLGNWNVMGLESTASYDYEVEDAYVPDDATFSFAAPLRKRGAPLFELGILPLTAAGHAGFAIGCVRRMLDELTELAIKKARFGADSALAGSERFQHALGSLDGRARAGAAWVREAYTRAERSAAERGVPDPRTVLDARQAVVHVTQDGAAIAREIYLLAGTSALREGPLQRFFRDLHAASQHFVAGSSPTLELAQYMLGGAQSSDADS